MSEYVKRTFRTRLTAQGDGRTVEGLIIPYGKPALVGDHDGSERYQEEWLKGAFRNQIKAPNRVPVLLNFEHYGARYDDVMQSGGSIESAFGDCTILEERDDGLHGTFEIWDTPAGDNALRMINRGIASAFSVAAKIKRTTRSAEGVVQRVRAHLDWVSLAREGAFPESRILAVRTAQLEEEHDAMPPFDPELALRFANAGLDVPEELGVDVLVLRASYSDAAWDGSAVEASLSASDYCAVSLVDNNAPGAPKVKAECHFPVRETPGGPVVIAALRAVVGGRGAQAKFPNAAEGVAKAKRLLAGAPGQSVNRAADPAEAKSAAALQDALSALRRYQDTEPEPEDRAVASDCVTSLELLLAKDQAEATGEDVPAAVGY